MMCSIIAIIRLEIKQTRERKMAYLRNTRNGDVRLLPNYYLMFELLYINNVCLCTR